MRKAAAVQHDASATKHQTNGTSRLPVRTSNSSQPIKNQLIINSARLSRGGAENLPTKQIGNEDGSNCDTDVQTLPFASMSIAQVVADSNSSSCLKPHINGIDRPQRQMLPTSLSSTSNLSLDSIPSLERYDEPLFNTLAHSTDAVESLTYEILEKHLALITYQPQMFRELGQKLSTEILTRLKSPTCREKLVVLVSLGRFSDQTGIQFGCRCLWNNAKDHFISVKYSNAFIYAVALIYVIHYDEY